MNDTPKSVPIAVIGLACRLPGAPDAAAFWQALLAGRDLVTGVPADRWEASAHPDFVSHGAFLPDVIGLDASFFSISESEAAFMCPQQRLLLELAWHTFEHAGIPPSRLDGTDTGVFVGLCGHDFSIQQWQRSESLYLGTGTSNAVAANRISFQFGLHGPSLAVDAACASSLSAVHLACRSIAHGECAQALAGSANVLLLPEVTANLAEAGVISKSGRCHSFGNHADGYVRSEGAAMLLLKRLDLAERDGDRILGVIRASGINHNGRSNGLTAPNPVAQVNLIRHCVGAAGVHPDAIDYVEAAATGTRIGDAIEVKAIKDALLAERNPNQPLALGSVKSNLGHLEGTGGIVGLVKALLCIQHGQIPPSLHSEQLNPMCQINGEQLLIPQRPLPWERAAEARIAAVSSFGFGGSNAHVLVQGVKSAIQPALSDASGTTPTWSLMVVSARSPKALQQLVTTLLERIESVDLNSARAIASASALSREQHRYRVAVPFCDLKTLRDGLQSCSVTDSGQRRTMCIALDDQVNEMLTIWHGLYQQCKSFNTLIDDLVNELPTSIPVLGWLRGESIPTESEALCRTALSYAIISWFQQIVQSPLAFQVDPTGELAAVARLSGIAAGQLPALYESPANRSMWLGKGKRLPVYVSHFSHQPWQHWLSQGKPDPTRTAFCQPDDLASVPERFLTDLLAYLYLQGARIDWSVLFSNTGRHADLPLYPFQHQYFWPTPTSRENKRAGQLPDVDWSGQIIPLPLLHQRRRQYQLDAANSSVLADHMIDGHLILSAAAQIAMVAQALLADFTNAAQITLTDVQFLAPSFLSTEVAIQAQLIVEPNGHDRGSCQLLTSHRHDPSIWQMVFSCTFKAMPVSSPSRPLPETCDLQSLAAGFYDAMAADGYQYGSSYRWLDRVQSSGEVGVYQLRNDSALPPTGLPWHPGLLDGCFHAIAHHSSGSRSRELRLPAGIAEIEIRRPSALPQVFLAQVRQTTQTSGNADFWLHDQHGQQLLAVKQVRFSSIAGSALTQFDQAQVGSAAVAKDEPMHPEQWLLQTLARVLGMPIESEHRALPLPSLGLDSLKAMELQGYLRRRFQLQLGVAQLLGGLTLEALAEQLSHNSFAAPVNSNTSTEPAIAMIDIESFDRSSQDALVEIEL